MLPVLWTEAAESDLTAIVGYIFERNPDASYKLLRHLKNSTIHLSEHPYLFRESERMPGYREIVAHPNYLVFYRVLADRVQVEMVAHARRLYPIER